MTQPDRLPAEQRIPVLDPAGRGWVLEGYPWQKIETFYHSLVVDYGWGCQPLHDLVTHIAAAPYATYLHAITSHATLMLHGYTPFHYDQEVVLIEWKGNNTLVFTYREEPYRPVAWEKTCQAEESLRVFEHLVIDLLKWVPKALRSPRPGAPEGDQDRS